jgi:hypothetical protein
MDDDFYRLYFRDYVDEPGNAGPGCDAVSGSPKAREDTYPGNYINFFYLFLYRCHFAAVTDSRHFCVNMVYQPDPGSCWFIGCAGRASFGWPNQSTVISTGGTVYSDFNSFGYVVTIEISVFIHINEVEKT